MKIVVTGATGFIGKAIVKAAFDKGYGVAALVRPDSDIKKLEEFKDLELITYTDLSDKSVANQLKKWQPDAMFHIAWKGVTGTHRNEPYQFIDNITFTLNSVELALAAGCKSWVGAGSQAEYGLHSGKITEDTVCTPTNAYGKAKLAASIAALGMCELSNMKGSWGRIFSTYGPEDFPGYFIPYVIEELLKGKSPELTKCEQIWDYLYVADAAQAFLSLAETECIGVFNVGSGKTSQLKDIVEHIKSIVNTDVEVNYIKPYAQNQVMHLEADITKITNATGWKPQIEIFDGLQKTIDFNRR